MHFATDYLQINFSELIRTLDSASLVSSIKASLSKTIAILRIWSKSISCNPSYPPLMKFSRRSFSLLWFWPPIHARSPRQAYHRKLKCCLISMQTIWTSILYSVCLTRMSDQRSGIIQEQHPIFDTGSPALSYMRRKLRKKQPCGLDGKNPTEPFQNLSMRANCSPVLQHKLHALPAHWLNLFREVIFLGHTLLARTWVLKHQISSVG